VARVVVDVMLKPEILDPQGQAVANALPRLGFDGIAAVRQGKRFELEVEGDLTPERLDEVRRAAETLLSNPVIEDFAIRVDGLGAGEPAGSGTAGEPAGSGTAGEPAGSGTGAPGEVTTAEARS
jgi:phosphoribosylformylglycinamidine synthase